LRPLVLCGQHSLPNFCLGVFLSFGVHYILVQHPGGVWKQIVLSIAGMAIMTSLAWLLDRAEKVPNLFVDVSESDIDRFEKIPNVFVDMSESKTLEATMKPGVA